MQELKIFVVDGLLREVQPHKTYIRSQCVVKADDAQTQIDALVALVAKYDGPTKFAQMWANAEFRVAFGTVLAESERAALQRANEALVKLVAALDNCKEAIDGALGFASIHGMDYTEGGKFTCGKQLEEARAAIAGQDAASEGAEKE